MILHSQVHFKKVFRNINWKDTIVLLLLVSDSCSASVLSQLQNRGFIDFADSVGSQKLQISFRQIAALLCSCLTATPRLPSRPDATLLAIWSYTISLTLQAGFLVALAWAHLRILCSIGSIAAAATILSSMNASFTVCWLQPFSQRDYDRAKIAARHQLTMQ